MVEDPDYIGHGEEARPLDVKELLVKANLIMELPRGVELGATVGSPFDPPPIDREMGMGGVRLASAGLQGTAEKGTKVMASQPL